MNDAPSVIVTAAQAGTEESWPRARLVRPDLAIHLFEREPVSAFCAVARLGSPMPVGVGGAPLGVAISASTCLSTPSFEGSARVASSRRGNDRRGRSPPSWKREADRFLRRHGNPRLESLLL